MFVDLLVCGGGDWYGMSCRGKASDGQVQGVRIRDMGREHGFWDWICEMLCEMRCNGDMDGKKVDGGMTYCLEEQWYRAELLQGVRRESLDKMSA
jgi:hypothetical protein